MESQSKMAEWLIEIFSQNLTRLILYLMMVTVKENQNKALVKALYERYLKSKKIQNKTESKSYKT